MTDDLWPDDIGLRTKLKAPVTILKEQGALLSKKTRNLVEGQIINISDRGIGQDNFGYVFHLVAPALGNYHYRLLTISHSVDFYPLDIDTDEDVLMELSVDMGASVKMRGGLRILVAGSQDEFMGILRAIFATKKVRRVIEAIIAQSSVGIEIE